MAQQMKDYTEEELPIIQGGTVQIVDKETGELVEVPEIEQHTFGQHQFWKVYMYNFMSALGILNSKQVDIFRYIIENIKSEGNIFIGTYKKIQEDVHVSAPTVATVMKKLQKGDFISQVSQGVWRVNPRFIIKGSENKRQMLITVYDDEKYGNAKRE